MLAILWYGGKLTIDEEIDIGDLSSFILYTLTLIMGLISAGNIINVIITAIGIAE